MEQHQRKDAAQCTAQGKGRAHPAQPVAHLLGHSGGLFLLSGSLLCGGGCLGGRLRRRFGVRRLCGSRAIVVQSNERQAHAVVLAGRRRAGGGRGCFLVLSLAEEVHGQSCMGLRRLVLRKHQLGHRRSRPLRLGIRLFFRSRLLDSQSLRGALLRLFGLRLRLRAEEHGLQRLHLPVLVLLLRGARAVLDGLFPGGRLFFRWLFVRLRGKRLRHFGLGHLGLFRFRLGHSRRFRRLRLRRLCLLFQLQDQLQLGGFLLLLTAQPDLTGALFHCTVGLRLRFLAAEQPTEQPLGLFVRFIVPSGHLLRDLRHTGRKKGTEFLVAGVDLFLRQFLPLFILWHLLSSLPDL